MLNPPVIEIADVTFTYPGSEAPVLNGASLTVEQGSFLAIIGGNGSGKSTLCKLFNGLIPHYYSGDYAGEVSVCGVSTLSRNVAELSGRVGYVYQDFENQLVRPTVLDEACFAPLNYALPDYRERAVRSLDLCGLSGLEDRFVWELSGGQKHLLALAGALSLEPDILVVDEPISQLDPSHARQVYEVLRKLNDVYGKTIVVIEHHTEFIADYCGQVCLMEKGRVLWKKPVAEALNSLEDLKRLGIQPPEVTQVAAKLSSLLNPAEEKTAAYPIHTEEGVRYFAEMIPTIRNADSERIRSDFASSTARESRSPLPASDSRSVIHLNDVSLSYRTVRKQEQPVLKGIRLELFEGERIALVGNNGAGKSSLLKLIAGIAKPTAGSVTVLGQNTKRISLERLSGQVSYIFQNPEDMFIEDTVRREIAHCLLRRKYDDAEARIVRALRGFRLEKHEQRDARLLSGGQQRRVSLAIGAAIRPEIMLLDEPTANLDLATREELLRTLTELNEHVRTVLIATHDMQLVSRWATRVIVMNDGLVAGDGSPDEIFAQEALIRLAGLTLTQSMELSYKLGLTPPSGSPAELAERFYSLIAGKETLENAASPQLVP